MQAQPNNLLSGLGNDAKLVGWIKEQYSSIKKSRGNLETQWYTNLAFFFGRQWVQLVSTTASSTGVRLFTPPAPPWRVRLVINKIRPIIRTELAKVTGNTPIMTVMPRTADDIDLTASRVADQILKCEYEEKKIKEKVVRATWWALITGTGFIKDYWSSSAKDRMGNVGDFKVESTTPFHIFVPDLKQEETEEQPFLIHASTMSVPIANARYKQNFTSADANVSAVQDLLNDAFLNLMGAPTVNKNQELLVLECWIKPGWHKDFMEGGLVTVIGDKVVVKQNQFPFSHGEYPFSKITHILSGRFYGTSVIDDLTSVQREYNRARSQVVENKNRMAKLQLLAMEGSVDPARMTSEPGQVILYKPGFQPPTPMPQQTLPSYVTEEIQRIQGDFDDISGQHEITRGMAPSHMSATGISFLQEQDDQKLKATVDSIESAIAKTGRHILTYAADYWSSPRLVRVMGADGSFDAQTYKGSDIHGNSDVIVEAGSGLPTSKAAKQAFIMDLIKLGALPIDKALQVLDIGGIEKIYQDFLVDRRQAQRENLIMAKTTIARAQQLEAMGQSSGAEVHDWDNDEVHIQIHNDFRKSQQFDTLSPETQQVFQLHITAHQMRMQAQQQALMNQQLGGQPGQPPGSPPQSGGEQPPGGGMLGG